MINIIGAGPAGLFAAMHLAKAQEVRVYEEHKEIGQPVQCTGLLSQDISGLIHLKKQVVLNKIREASVYAPNGKSLEIKFKTPNLVVDRAAFDLLLAEKAEQAGAVIHTGSKLICVKGKALSFRSDGNSKKIPAPRILIGADGPLSPVAKAFGLYNNRTFWLSEQYLIENKDIDRILYYPYYGKTAWAVPQGDGIVRVGAGRALHEKPNLDAFAKRFKGKRLCRQAGLIPLFHPDIKTQARVEGLKVFLVGDAAAQMKNTTGGAIIPSLNCAKILADCITKGENYERAWKKAVGKELNFHFKLRKAFEKFSSRDWDRLVELCVLPKVKKVLESASRDNAKNLIPRVILAEPRFLLFAKKFF